MEKKKKRPNEKGKGSSKDKKIQCFICEGLRPYAQDCPSSKKIKKSMQATWSDTNFKKSVFIVFEDARYVPIMTC